MRKYHTVTPKTFKGLEGKKTHHIEILHKMHACIEIPKVTVGTSSKNIARTNAKFIPRMLQLVKMLGKYQNLYY